MKTEDLMRTLAEKEAELGAAHSELSQTNSELMRLTLELDERVATRTAELLEANKALQAENCARRQVELRLLQQAELLDKANEIIVSAGLDGRISFWNRGAERLLGWSASEMMGRPVAEVLALDELRASCPGAQPFRALADWRGEIRTRKKDGAEVILEASVTALRDEADQAVGWLSISGDVTEKKALQEKFLRAQRLESIGMLASGIAHDLNNVLAPISLAGELLRTRLTGKSDLRYLETLERSVARGAALVRQILGFAHGIGGEHRVVQVKHLVRDIAAMISQTFPKSVVLEESVPSDLWPIQGQPTQIHQILLNLCVNARDAMPGGGTLKLTAENRILSEAEAGAIPDGRPGSWIVLSVEDSGSGIPPEVMARIWEPFFTTKADKGTGLGLATVRGIVETHKGFLTLDTAVGRGTTFRVYLPADATATVGADTGAEKAADRGHSELILVVDDEESNRETVQDSLAISGYRVLTAGDGAEAAALLAARSAEVALVITDYDMPVLDGSGLIQMIRARHPKMKVLMISGDDRMRNAECDAKLPKPYTIETLLREVAQLLPGRGSLQAAS